MKNKDYFLEVTVIKDSRDKFEEKRKCLIAKSQISSITESTIDSNNWKSCIVLKELEKDTESPLIFRVDEANRVLCVEEDYINLCTMLINEPPEEIWSVSRLKQYIKDISDCSKGLPEDMVVRSTPLKFKPGYIKL